MSAKCSLNFGICSVLSSSMWYWSLLRLLKIAKQMGCRAQKTNECKRNKTTTSDCGQSRLQRAFHRRFSTKQYTPQSMPLVCAMIFALTRYRRGQWLFTETAQDGVEQDRCLIFAQAALPAWSTYVLMAKVSIQLPARQRSAGNGDRFGKDEWQEPPTSTVFKENHT